MPTPEQIEAAAKALRADDPFATLSWAKSIAEIALIAAEQVRPADGWNEAMEACAQVTVHVPTEIEVDREYCAAFYDGCHALLAAIRALKRDPASSQGWRDIATVPTKQEEKTK